jgi:hypothetical protein
MPLRGALTAMMTFRHRHIVDAKPPSRRIVRASSLSSLKPFSRFSGPSRFNFRSTARVFFGVIGIFAGTYACCSSALAEVEEDSNQEAETPGYIIPALSDDIMTNLVIGNHTDKGVANYSTFDNSHDDAEFARHNTETYTGSYPAFPSSTYPQGFDNAHIPEAVWSLDVSTGAHLDHIPDSSGSEVYAFFGGRPETTDAWLGEIFGSGSGNNTSRASGVLGAAALQFQVASCGGSSAEHSNLDYCSSAKLVSNQASDSPSEPEQSNNNTATQSTSNNVLSPNDGPASYLSAQTITAPLAPSIANNSLLPGTLSVLGCDIFASCASVLIDPLETPTDIDPPETQVDAVALDPPPPIGDLAPPIDQFSDAPPPGPTNYGGDPGSGPSLPPVFTSQPLKPIPEASTWVMTIIGFSVMAFAFGKRRRPRINPISIIDVS